MSNIINPIILSGIVITAETRPLFEAARLTGDPNVLSIGDAIGKVLIDEARSEDVSAGPCHSDWLLTYGYRTPQQVREERIERIKGMLKTKSIEEVMKEHVAPFESARVTIQKQAERFMEDARALIEKIRASQKPAQPQPQPLPWPRLRH